MLKLRPSQLALIASIAIGTPALCTAQDEAPEEKPEENKEPERVQGALPWEWSEQLTWRSIGPANMGGRIISMAVHPTDPCVYWIGTAAGGLLKTVNNGVTYEHQFTDENTCSIGAVAVAPTNPDTVWVGTGENNPRNSVSWGDGVYKSTDGGSTWTHMGLKESTQVSTIIVHPEDENVVYVGALGHLWGPNEERGLFKTTDGGETWENILFIDDKTGVIDIRMRPDDSDTLLVATYERERDLFCTNDPSKKWGPGSGIYRTTDGGKTFERISEGLPTCDLGRIGLDWYVKDPNVVYAVIESEQITQQPENAAYLGVRGESAEVGVRLREVTEESPAEEAGLQVGDYLIRMGEKTILTPTEMTREIRQYVAGDEIEFEVVRDQEAHLLKVTFGETPVPEDEEEEDRTDVHGRPRPGPFHGGLGGQRENMQDQQGADGHQYGGVFRSEDGGLSWTRINSVNPRPMYYSEIRVDPSDDNYIYVLGTSLYRSKDRGETFTPDGHDRSVHVDHHAMLVDSNDGRHIMLGNDGGLYITWDRMEQWDHHNHVAIGQFYNVSVDTSRDYKVYGGLQDNGSWGGPNRVRNGAGPTNTDWFRVGGGDGFVCRVDANDPDLVYYESQNGGMSRRNLRTGEGGFIRPRGQQGVRYRFNWNTPFILSNHNSKIHYAAGNHVFRSLDRGNGARRISPEITASDRGSATSLAESVQDPDVLYVGTDDGALWTTRNGGHDWIDLWTLNEGIETHPEAIAKAETQAEPEAEPKAETVAFTPEEAPEATAPDDPVSGRWKCKAMGEGIEEDDEGLFELVLKLGDDGKVTGTIDSEIGQGAISGGRFDAQEDRLRFSFSTDSLTLEFEGKIEDDELEGEINAAGGAFSFTFRGERSDEGAARAVAEVEEIEEIEEQAQDPEEADEDEEQDEEKKKEKKRKFKKNTIDQVLPERFYVSSITPSRHKSDRVYVTFDGHRSDDTAPYVFVSENAGETWKSLVGNLPDSVGSVRDLDEDIENDDVLYLGTEFGAFVSIDRGKSWTELGGNLPTVPVHDFAQHPTSGELIAGTHGRSIWIVDVTPLRQFTDDTLDADAHLYVPNGVTRWRSEPSAGSAGTRAFVGENPPSGAAIYYSLDKRERNISLNVLDLEGNVVREFQEVSGDKGLHRVVWDLRRAATREDSRGRRRFRRGGTLPPGTYQVVLSAGGETYTQKLEILNDPAQVDTRWMEFEEVIEAMEAGPGIDD